MNEAQGDPQREALEYALTQWAASRSQVDAARDPLVRKAVEVGISKHHVHVITGIARTTIDRITREDRQS